MIGYDLGKIMIKIGREVPVASMDNSEKILWAKHNEIQTVSIKAVKELGSCDLYPQLGYILYRSECLIHIVMLLFVI